MFRATALELAALVNGTGHLSVSRLLLGQGVPLTLEGVCFVLHLLYCHKIMATKLLLISHLLLVLILLLSLLTLLLAKFVDRSIARAMLQGVLDGHTRPTSRYLALTSRDALLSSH